VASVFCPALWVAAQVSLVGFLRRQQAQDSRPLIWRRLYRHPNREGYSTRAFERHKLVLWRIIQLIRGRDLFQPFTTADRARWGALGHIRIMRLSTILRNAPQSANGRQWLIGRSAAGCGRSGLTR